MCTFAVRGGIDLTLKGLQEQLTTQSEAAKHYKTQVCGILFLFALFFLNLVFIVA